MVKIKPINLVIFEPNLVKSLPLTILILYLITILNRVSKKIFLKFFYFYNKSEWCVSLSPPSLIGRENESEKQSFKKNNNN